MGANNRFSLPSLVLSLALTALLVACGGGGPESKSPRQHGPSPQGSPAELSLPLPPGGGTTVIKGISVLVQDGGIINPTDVFAYHTEAAGDVELDREQEKVVLTPSAAASFPWVLYRLQQSENPPRPIKNLAISEEQGGSYRVGIFDFSHGRWDWQGPFSRVNIVDFPLSVSHLDSEGAAWLIILAEDPARPVTVGGMSPELMPAGQASQAPPQAVFDLSATQGNFTDRVELAWSATQGATRYRIERAFFSPGEEPQFALLTEVEAPGYIDQGVNPNTLYVYRVTALGPFGASAPSAPAPGYAGTLLSPLVEVSGSVEDGDGQPIPGVTLRAVPGGFITRTGSDGSFSLMLPPGEVYLLRPLYPGYRFSPPRIELGAPDGLADPVSGILFVGTGLVRASRLEVRVKPDTNPTILYPTKVVISSPGCPQLSDCLASLTVDWGDGSPPENLDPAALPEGTATHTYQAGGTYTVTVSGVDSQGFNVGPAATQVQVSDQLERRVLVVVNQNSPVSQAIADYYMSPDTGRAIDPAHRFEVDLPDAAASRGNETITRDQYENNLRAPLEQFLQGNPEIRDSIKYIVLTKGIPIKIQNTGSETCSAIIFNRGTPFNNDINCAAVDAELTFVIQSNDPVPFEPGSFYWNPFYGDQEPLPFTPLSLIATHAVDNNKQARLDYLVTRLDGYTLADVLAEIDRALNPYTAGDGWAILDGDKNYDRMEDDFSPGGYGKGAYTLIQEAGGNVYYDADFAGGPGYPTFLTRETIGDDSISQRVIFYAGHGVHHNPDPPSNNLYILNDLNFGYLNGAFFISYESFNGGSLFAPPDDPDGVPDNHTGQGNIADFIHMGGTAAIGNVYEPFASWVGDERFHYPAFLQGAEMGEAAYRGLIGLSWQEIVVGDPLYRLVP